MHRGPYTAHIRYAPSPRREAHTVSVIRKTFKAAENALYWSQVGVEAKWITNAQGVVYSAFAKGDPASAQVAA